MRLVCEGDLLGPVGQHRARGTVLRLRNAGSVVRPHRLLDRV